MLAIKGTNKNMQCRDFQYEFAKAYKMGKEPKLCEHGFHACLNPYDVLKYYSNMEGNRFFLVELGGTITKCQHGDDCWSGDTKVASNEITFLREVTVDDFPQLFEEFLKDKERLNKMLSNKDVASIRLNDKYNLINTKGEYISKVWFDWCDDIHEGFARVRLNDKCNFINDKGEYLSDQWFDDCSSFSEGFAVIELNGKYNYINGKGGYLSEQWFDECGCFYEGFACVKLDGKWNFINPNGEYLSEQWFDWCYNFNEGFGTVKLNGRYNFIKPNGEYLSEQWFDDCHDFYKGLTVVYINNKWRTINTKGEFV